MAIETESYFVSWPVLNMETPPSSGSAQNGSSSPTLRWNQISIIKNLYGSLVDLAQEDAFAENCTAMAEYITMLSWYSIVPTTLGTRIALMSEELTPISNQYDGLLEEHTNTCRRMVTSSSTISRTTILTGLEHLHQLIGLTSSLHQTKQLFLRKSARWILELSFALSQASRNTQTGHTERNNRNTNRQSSTLREMTGSERNSMNGTRRHYEGEQTQDGE